MGRDKRRERGRSPPFVMLLKETLDTPAWRAMSHGARSLYVAIKRRYSERLLNNGHVHVSLREAAKELNSHRDQCARWFRRASTLRFYCHDRSLVPGRQWQRQSAALAADRDQLPGPSADARLPSLELGAFGELAKNRIPARKTGPHWPGKQGQEWPGKQGHLWEQVAWKSGPYRRQWVARKSGPFLTLTRYVRRRSQHDPDDVMSDPRDA